MAGVAGLREHLETGATTVCRAWALERSDGLQLGFTDHDEDLAFDGLTYRADTGLTALALQQSTGLSVDNTEAIGALSDASLKEDDILAGRFDGAEIRGWLVNWEDPQNRELVFRGTLGELTRVDGSFRAEVRGLAEALNKPIGRVIQKTSTRLIDDTGAPYNLNQPGFRFQGELQAIAGGVAFLIDTDVVLADGWFRHGTCFVQTGESAGLSGVIKRDEIVSGLTRRVELWEPLRPGLQTGDRVLIDAGFDGRFETSRFKFDNALNFQGFPDVPEDDWIVTPAPTALKKSGGSRR